MKKRTETVTTPRKTSTALPVTSNLKPTAPVSAPPLPTAFALGSRPPAPRPTPRSVPPRPQTAFSTLIEHNEQVRRERIAMAAYLRAEKNGFCTDPVENWLAAEREVDGRMVS